MSTSHPSISAPTCSPSRSCCGRSSALTTVTSTPRRRIPAATSHPTNPDPMTATGPGRSSSRVSSRSVSAAVLIVSSEGSSPPGTGSVAAANPWPGRSAPTGWGRATSPPPASPDRDRSPASRGGRRRRAAAYHDRATRGRSSRCCCPMRYSLLTAGRKYGRPVIGRHEQDRCVAAGLPVRRRRTPGQPLRRRRRGSCPGSRASAAATRRRRAPTGRRRAVQGRSGGVSW